MMQASRLGRSNMASVLQALGVGRGAVTGAIVYSALFAALWLSESLAVATFAAIVLLAFGLAVRVVAGLCGILDHARKGELVRRETITTMLAGVALAALIFMADLPMETITKASLVVGVIVYFVTKYAFRA
jgi:hypothetical protein